MKTSLTFLLLVSTFSSAAASSEVCNAENPDASCSASFHNTPQEQEQPFKCKDRDENCEAWSKVSFGDDDIGACQMNSAFMTQYCPITCNTCAEFYLGWRLSKMVDVEGGLSVIPFCQDNNFNCRQFAEQGECEKNPGYMNTMCQASCGICAEERYVI